MSKIEEKQEEEVINQLHLKYRPQILDEIIGQDHVVNSLKCLMSSNKLPHVFLFTGNSGTGKTSFARVLARYLKCDKNNIIEIDAATFGGVDDMRKLNDGLAYRAFGENPIKFVIVDEAGSCFFKDTFVLTDKGNVEIGNICVGDNVFNKDGLSKVLSVFKNRVCLRDVIRLTLSNGNIIFCTREHLFWVGEDKWVQAEQLNFKHCRYREQGIKVSNRSRWKGTRYSETKDIGQEKGRQVKRVKVESVEIYKRGSNDESFKGVIGDKERDQGFIEFYDLEVEGHPSYYANNVLVHNCSKKAWEAALKVIEEPPEHVYFAFCTTESHKVPRTIETRCHGYHLKDISTDDILDLLDIVNEDENINLDDKCLGLIADKALGSVRQALVYLSKARGCKSADEVKEILEVVEGSAEIIELCRVLNEGGKWTKAVKILKGLNSNNPESIRLCIVKYFTTCVLNAKGKGDSVRYLSILDSFSKPIYDVQNGMADIILSVGEVLLED